MLGLKKYVFGLHELLKQLLELIKVVVITVFVIKIVFEIIPVKNVVLSGGFVLGLVKFKTLELLDKEILFEVKFVGKLQLAHTPGHESLRELFPQST